MPYSRRSRRIVAATGAALLLTIGAAFSYTIYHARASEVAEWSEQLENTSLLLADQTSQEMRVADLVLDGMLERARALKVSTTEELHERLGTAAEHQRLLDWKHALPLIDVATVVDAGGTVVNFTRSFPAPSLNLADRSHFIAQRDTPGLGLFVSQPVRNRSNGGWSFYLSRRIEAPNGRFLGIVMVGISSRQLSDAFSKINLGREASVTLYRRDYTVLARWPHIDTAMGIVNTGGSAYDVLERRRLDHGVLISDGPRQELRGLRQQRISAARVIPGFPLVISVAATDALYLQQWREYALQLGAAGAICLLAVCVALGVLLQSMRKRDAAMREQARLKAEADAANRAKSDFLAMMSHEIRTPLTAVIGFAEFLQRSSRDEESVEYSGIIARNGQHLLSLINDILDMSKIESGKLLLECVAFAPHDVGMAALASMRGQAELRGIDLELSADGPLPTAVMGDPTRWRQILFNLVSNAVKFTERGGVDVRLAYRAAEEALVCTVRDTGIGMSEDEQARLFRPFEQADSSVGRRFGGTGLGLHLVQRLALSMGGRIAVDSALGQGTTVTVAVHAPLAPGAALVRIQDDADARAHASAPPRLGGRVLLVEDGVDNRLLIGALLQQCGLEVIHAEDGAQGLARALMDRPDLIVMDIQMPRMDGLTALHELRQRGFKRPVIALTANAMQADRVRYLEAGFDACLPKPVERAAFYGVLAQFLRAPEQV